MANSDQNSGTGSSHAANLEVDENSDEAFSILSSNNFSLPSTTSLRLCLSGNIKENGRTYHAFNPGKYMLPNDEEEQARLHLQHHCFRMTMDGKLFQAPISNPKNVLDIATGTGIWAIEFAQEHPSSMVVGIDLSPILNTETPSNCRFEIKDAEEEWMFDRKFDFIHARAVLSCFRDPRAIVAAIFENLSPGGYFELQDPCMPFRSDDETLTGTALDEWQKHLISGSKMMGRDVCDSTNWGKYMADVGFVDIMEMRHYWGTSPWMRGEKQKLQALWTQQNLLNGVGAMSMAIFTRVLGWKNERIESLLVKVREDLKNQEIHAYAEMFVVYGRKPEG